MFSITPCCIVPTELLRTFVDFCGLLWVSTHSLKILKILVIFIFHALCAARSFLHRLSLDYFCALRYALDSHMLNMLCNNISCNVILCYIIYVMYVQLWLYKTKLESMCTCTSPISVYHLSLIAICITSGFQLQFVSTRY
jgi:hypothetical protein